MFSTSSALFPEHQPGKWYEPHYSLYVESAGKKNFFIGTKDCEVTIDQGQNFVMGQVRVLKQRSNGSCGYYCLFNSVLLVACLFAPSDEKCTGMNLVN
jgi:hypothetical protein